MTHLIVSGSRRLRDFVTRKVLLMCCRTEEKHVGKKRLSLNEEKGPKKRRMAVDSEEK